MHILGLTWDCLLRAARRWRRGCDWEVERILFLKVFVERFPESGDFDKRIADLVDGLDLWFGGVLIGSFNTVEKSR